MMFQELVIFAEKNISARKYIFGVFLFFQRGKLHQLKKKNHNKTSLHKYVQVFSYYNINMRISLVYVCTPLDKFSHTRPVTQMLLPLHACTQTLHSHVKLLTHNQSSKFWRSLTRTQMCFIPSHALENHVNHLSLFNLPTRAK